MNLTRFAIITSYFVCTYALIMNITLMVESEDDIVDGNSLASLNEGAGVNFFFWDIERNYYNIMVIKNCYI